jgi:RimJ/RimL family protein N-acetyltransferase
VTALDEIVAETPRLRLRRLRLGDIDDVAAMVADPEQMRFYPQTKPRDEVAEWLAWNLGLYADHGFGTWYLESRSDAAFAGYCGLRPRVFDGSDEVEVAWHVKRTLWNQGVATEAARTAMRLGFDRFGLPSLVAIIHPDNHPSRRVAQKLGMAAERPLVVDGEPTFVYRAAETASAPLARQRGVDERKRAHFGGEHTRTSPAQELRPRRQ